jgi:aminopeptidase YwaD
MHLAATTLNVALILAAGTLAPVAGAAPVDGAAVKAEAARPAPQDEVSAERLIDGIKLLPTKRAPLGDQEHVDGLLKTEKLIQDRLTALGYEVTPHEFPVNMPFRDVSKDADGKVVAGEARFPTLWRNFIAELPGTDLKNEVLILGAHFDAVWNSPGADDNGSGTSGLMELARVLKDRPMRRTVRFVFFNVEEQGLIGSRAYWAHIEPRVTAGEEKIVGMVSLEMLGYFTDAPNSQRSPKVPVDKSVFDPPTVGDFIAIATTLPHQKFSRRLGEAMQAAAPGLKVLQFDFSPIPLPDIMRSDHAPFIMGNQPAVMLTDTANFRNPNYHKPTDTIETIEAARFALVVKGLAGAAYAIANEKDAAKPADAGKDAAPAVKPVPVGQ